jgi:cation:H+ antiporter
MTVTLLWLQLAGAAAIILVASHFLARSADVIAVKTGLGRAFIGVVLLSTATSLPELGTGVGAIALFGEPDLAAGDAFGSNLFNLLIIGLLDLFWRNGPILNSVGVTSAIVGALGIAVISLAAIALLVHGMTSTMSTWYVSPITIVTFIVFLFAMYLIYRFEHPSDQRADPAGAGEAQLSDPDAPGPTLVRVLETEGGEHEYAAASLSRAAVTYIIVAFFVVGAAIWLAATGDKIATAMGWEASFVGTQFLAFSTSLPELAASFAAIRINAPELAITGLLGSNLFNMGFILFMDDLAFTEGALWANVSSIHPLTAFIAVLMTSVVIFAVVSRGRRRPHAYWTTEALLLIGLYLAASFLVFFLTK